MSEAPEHIYVGPSVDDKGVFWDVGHWDKEPYDGCLKYVRADRIEELEAKLARYDDLVADKINLRSENETLKAKLAKAVGRLNKLTYWLDIDQELWDAFTIMEKSDHRHMQSEVQTIKDILTGGRDE